MVEEKKNKRKERRQRQRARRKELKETRQSMVTSDENREEKDDGVEVEYVSSDIPEEFAEVFARFSRAEALMTAEEPQQQDKSIEDKLNEEEFDDEIEEEGPKTSNRKKRLLNRLSVAELKQLVKQPEVVEIHDVTAQDPRLLVYLKSYRNSVPVPQHWSQKRKYLEGKRGFEKPPFRLPDFIDDTGIRKMREAYAEVDSKKSMKQKLREKIRPKGLRMDLDYEVLHDAFFRFQRKPPMTRQGDLYYEKKEFEASVRNAKPGHLSVKVREALGVQEGHPPPFLFNMQRVGPPPSYPKLKIPGLNAPLPPKAHYGFHPGGWGQPPVDDYGRALFGDPFGNIDKVDGGEGMIISSDAVDHWGTIEEEPEEIEEEEEEEEEVGEEAPVEEVVKEVKEVVREKEEVPVDDSGLMSISAGLETPEVIDIRKKKRELYTKLEEEKTNVSAESFIGSDHKYATTAKERGIEVALQPEDFSGVDKLGDISQGKVRQLYESQKNVEQEKARQDSVSEMVKKEIQKRERKRMREKEKSEGGDRAKKKYKDYRF